MILALLSFFIVLVPLIIIHELGHFFAAKSVGITVLEFGIGFPPRAATLFTKGETIYTLNWVPLGGFVRPLGEDMVRPKTQDEMADDLKELEGRSGDFEQKSMFDAGPWERMWFMFAGPLANFIAAFVLFVVIAFIGQPETNESGVVVKSIEEDSPAALAGLQEDDFIVAVNGEPVITHDDYNAMVTGLELVDLTVERDDETLNLPLTPNPSSSTDGENLRVVVLEVSEDSPAEEAGVRENDIILAVSQEPIFTTDELIAGTRDRDGKETIYTIERNGEEIDLTITPRYMGNPDRPLIGVTVASLNLDIGLLTQQAFEVDVITAENIGDGINTGTETFVNSMELIVEAPIMLIRGQLSPEQARPVSIVGISQIGGEVIRESQDQGELYPILGFAAIISIALAVTNLLPIPGLDGGRILFVIVELLRGKPLEPEREGMVHLIGILFLLSLMVFVIALDIIDPIV